MSEFEDRLAHHTAGHARRKPNTNIPEAITKALTARQDAAILGNEHNRSSICKERTRLFQRWHRSKTRTMVQEAAAVGMIQTIMFRRWKVAPAPPITSIQWKEQTWSGPEEVCDAQCQYLSELFEKQSGHLPPIQDCLPCPPHIPTETPPTPCFTNLLQARPCLLFPLDGRDWGCGSHLPPP